MNQGRIKRGGDRPPKTYEINFIHHDFVQFGKQHSRYKAILPSIILSQQCCEVCFIASSLSQYRIQNETRLPSITEIVSPLTLLARSAPEMKSQMLFSNI